MPLDTPAVARTLDRLADSSALVGVRPMIQDIPDDDWMLGEAVARGLEALTARGLAFDALVLPRHLWALHALCERHPDLRVVVDHAAKPAIRDGAFDTWARDLGEIADTTDACCKLSGLVTEAAPDWRVDDLRRYVDWLLERFGPDRLFWGSDWPVVELAGGFERWHVATHELLAALSDDERFAILGGNAARFYRLDPAPHHEGKLS